MNDITYKSIVKELADWDEPLARLSPIESIYYCKICESAKLHDDGSVIHFQDCPYFQAVELVNNPPDDKITVESLEKLGFEKTTHKNGLVMYNKNSKPIHAEFSIFIYLNSMQISIKPDFDDEDAFITTQGIKTIIDLKTLWQLLTGEELTNETN